MKREFTKMDWFFAICMAACLLAYLYSCLTGKPIEQIKDMMQYFGVGLGLTAGKIVINNLGGGEKDADKTV